jgi:hypothetical protein
MCVQKQNFDIFEIKRLSIQPNIGCKCKVSLDCIDKFTVLIREKALPENPIAHERLVEEIRIETIQIKRSRSERIKI